jgi:uncharacterized protein YndB with AHSA1/START domain
MHVRLEKTIEIERPPQEVFDFVADPRNDRHWCPRVIRCEQREGDGVSTGARFEALHNPTFLRTHTRSVEILDVDPGRRVTTRQEDDIGIFNITYTLVTTPTATRLTQRDDIAWKIVRPAHPIARLIVRRHMADQLKRLKRLLEASPASAELPHPNRA